jgi:hypothetical protein
MKTYTEDLTQAELDVYYAILVRIEQDEGNPALQEALWDDRVAEFEDIVLQCRYPSIMFARYNDKDYLALVADEARQQVKDKG